MSRVCSIFSQLLQFPRVEFETAVRKHKAERHACGFTCCQFVAMLFSPGHDSFAGPIRALNSLAQLRGLLP
jgi:Domain of unknown function (DUF4372)